MRVLWICAGMIALSGCMAPRIDASSYAVDYNRTVAIEANETTLLNIVRASYRDTQHFTSINSITAEFTATQATEVGLSTGGDTLSDTMTAVTQTLRDTSGNRTGNETTTLTNQSVDGSRTLGGSAGYSLSYEQQPTFAISVSNTPEFARGIASPIDITTFGNVLSQGYPDEMVLALLVDEIILVLSGKKGDDKVFKAMRVANPIANPGDTGDCEGDFYRRLQQHLEYRLVRAEPPPAIATFEPTPANLDSIDTFLAAGYQVRNAKGELEVYPRPSGPPFSLQSNLGDSTDLLAVARNCLNSVERTEEGLSFVDLQDRTTTTTTTEDGDISMRLVLRSPQSVIEAIGAYHRSVTDCFIFGESAPTTNSSGRRCGNRIFIDGALGASGDDLLRIERGSTSANPGYSPAHTTYSGYRWIVPPSDPSGGEGHGHRTMQVFQLVQMLVNLNRSADELRAPAFIQLD